MSLISGSQDFIVISHGFEYLLAIVHEAVETRLKDWPESRITAPAL